MFRTQTRGVAIAVLGALVALAGRPPRLLGAQQDTTRRAMTVASRRLSLDDALRECQETSVVAHDKKEARERRGQHGDSTPRQA